MVKPVAEGGVELAGRGMGIVFDGDRPGLQEPFTDLMRPDQGYAHQSDARFDPFSPGQVGGFEVEALRFEGFEEGFDLPAPGISDVGPL